MHLVTNSLFVFNDFTSYLHSLHTLQEGKKKLTRREEKNFFFCFFFFLFSFRKAVSFVINSLHSCQKDLYMTVCSKKCPFQFVGHMNNWVNHINGIRLFSCTEPPSKKSDIKTEWMGWARGQIWDYNFSVASLKNVHSTHNTQEWVVYEQLTGRGNI